MRIELMRRIARSLELVDLIPELEAKNVLAADAALSELRHELENMKRALLAAKGTDNADALTRRVWRSM